MYIYIYPLTCIRKMVANLLHGHEDMIMKGSGILKQGWLVRGGNCYVRHFARRRGCSGH